MFRKTLSFHSYRNLCQDIMLQIKLQTKFGDWPYMMMIIMQLVLMMELSESGTLKANKSKTDSH